MSEKPVKLILLELSENQQAKYNSTFLTQVQNIPKIKISILSFTYLKFKKLLNTKISNTSSRLKSTN